jgi:hypothetical protein
MRLPPGFEKKTVSETETQLRHAIESSFKLPDPPAGGPAIGADGERFIVTMPVK